MTEKLSAHQDGEVFTVRTVTFPLKDNRYTTAGDFRKIVKDLDRLGIPDDARTGYCLRDVDFQWEAPTL